MHANDLVELAALVTLHARTLHESKLYPAPQSLERYWVASKSRLERWTRAIKHYDQTRNLDSSLAALEWRTLRPVLEEILISEILTRVWAAVLCTIDRRHGTIEVEPVARSVLIGHLESRHRALGLLVREVGVTPQDAVALNRLRRRAERWADLLLGCLLGSADVAEFAIDPARARDFAADLQEYDAGMAGKRAWRLMLTSLRSAFPSGRADETANSDLNERIAGSVVAGFPPELFDSLGMLHSLWYLRLSNVADDAQVMIDDLLTDRHHPPEKPAESQNVADETEYRDVFRRWNWS